MENQKEIAIHIDTSEIDIAQEKVDRLTKSIKRLKDIAKSAGIDLTAIYTKKDQEQTP